MNELLHSLQTHSALLQFITNYSTLQQWLPLVFVALLGSMALVAAYYMAGVLVNSKKIKETAIYEFGQAIGTGIIVVIIIGALWLASSGLQTVLPPSNTAAICNTLKGSPVDIVNSIYTSQGSVLNQNDNGASPTEVVCTNIINTVNGEGSINGHAATTDITPDLDYGLGAVYVVTANMTNQTAANLNSMYVFTNYIGFLQSFVVRQSVCWPPTCLAGESPGFRVIYSYTPLLGYAFLTSGALLPLQFQAIFMFQMQIVQLIFIILMLYSWPYLLAGGLILRATIFGRRIGGLLFAIAVTAVITYPLVFMMEYSAFSSNTLSPIGIPGNAIPETFNYTASPAQFQSSSTTSTTFNDLNIYELPTNDFYPDSANTVVYKFNAFVFPKFDQVINANGCWPGLSSAALLITNVVAGPYSNNIREAAQGNLLAAEASFASFYLIPLTGLGTGLGNLLGTALGFVSSVPYVPTTCTQNNAMQTFFAAINVYSIMSIEGVILPILNILIALVSIKGLSGLLGGDQDIIGLGKLV